jgi:hypothetical protein
MTLTAAVAARAASPPYPPEKVAQRVGMSHMSLYPHIASKQARVEAIIWTLKNQLGLERHGGRIPAGLWARIVQRLLALNAAIWHNWQIGTRVSDS